MLELLRRSRIGALGIGLIQTRIPRSSNSTVTEMISEFGPWADVIWEQCRNRYSFIGVRDKDTLNVLYPPSDSRFIRLKMSRRGNILGWTVLLKPKLSGHRYFGNMHVGSIADCLALPEHAGSVVACACEYLRDQKVDMIVSNQANESWCEALLATGFIRGPSNFILGLSPALIKELSPIVQAKRGIHINRGDGEGPTIL
jgi:hypothetical protein